MIENKHLRWGCRRGMLELDCLLLPFFDRYFHQLSEVEQKVFAELLHYSDADLYEWFIGSSPPPSSQLDKMIKLIKSKMPH